MDKPQATGKGKAAGASLRKSAKQEERKRAEGQRTRGALAKVWRWCNA